MTESSSGMLNVTSGPPAIIYELDTNPDSTVGTSETEIIAPRDSTPYNNGSLVLYNGGTGGALTARVFVSNLEAQGVVGAASNGWAKLGNDISVASGASSAVQWSGIYRWLTIRGLLATSEKSDVNTNLMLIHQ